MVVPREGIQALLGKYGIGLEEKPPVAEDGVIQMNASESQPYKLVTSPESTPMSAGDKAALQTFLNDYMQNEEMTPNSFLNARQALANLAKYDATKTTASNTLADGLRTYLNAVGRSDPTSLAKLNDISPEAAKVAESTTGGLPQIPGLSELDAAYAPERQLLNKIKSDYLDKDGNLKDSAINKIANITGAGKDMQLSRLEKIVPDISYRVRLLKAVEDIQKAEGETGQKVGTYVRGSLIGGAALTMNLPVIIGAIMSFPQMAVPLIKGLGLTGDTLAPVLNGIKKVASFTNATPGMLTPGGTPPAVK